MSNKDADEKHKIKSKSSKEESPDEIELTPVQIEALAEAQAKAATERLAEARKAAEEAAEKEYQAAAAEAVTSQAGQSFTDKHAQDIIFRREMGEPEFWLGRDGLVPPRPVLTQDEALEISRRVEVPTDQTPAYKPQHILSPEYYGTSNYERGIMDFKQELEEKFQSLKADPNSSPKQILQAKEDMKTLDYLYENFNIGMNVFRTAKGGRDKLRE